MHVRIDRMYRIDRHSEDFFVVASLILHEQHPDRAASHDCTRDDRDRSQNEHVNGVAIPRTRVRNKSVIAGIEHRGVPEAVNKYGPRFLVELIFDWSAPLWDFDDNVDVVRWVATDRNLGDIHVVEPLK